MTEKGIDDMPPAAKKEEEEEEEELRLQDWSWYFHPAQSHKLITGRFWSYFVLVLVYYMFQLVACICSVNFYGDIDRFNACNDKDLKAPVDAAAVFDLPLLLMAIYHIIEWVKATLLLTVVLVGINLMWVYLVLCLNTVYGVVAIIVTMLVRFSADGDACAEAQVTRGQWLFVEVIGFWVLLFFFPSPLSLLRCCSKESHDEIIYKKDEDSDDEDDD